MLSSRAVGCEGCVRVEHGGDHCGLGRVAQAGSLAVT